MGCITVIQTTFETNQTTVSTDHERENPRSVENQV